MRARHRLAILGALAIASATAYAAGSATVEKGPYYALPAWDQQFKSPANRFVVLANWNSEAVLDKETGLVWELTPVTDTFTWAAAAQQCRQHLVGNRRGWRLSSYEELTSLLDATQSNPALPAGHPFQGIGGADSFWTVTQSESDANFAYDVQIANATTWITAAKDNFNLRIWCVRGGSSVSNPPY